MKVGYLGPLGSFSYTATTEKYAKEELIPYATIQTCIKAVQDKQVDIAVVPIENTIEGTVNPTLDYLFHKSNLNVISEIVLPISQQLMIHKENKKEWRKASKVLSHPQALAQCQEFIGDNFGDIIVETTDSTAAAAKIVAECKQENLVAIGPTLSAKEYDLDIIQSNIQDIPHNQTRFWVVSRHGNLLNEELKKKASICITMPKNSPGVLHQALSTFSWRNIDLSKIESRPLKTTLGEYFFLIDIVVDVDISLIEFAVEEIQALGGKVKILGYYNLNYVTGI